MIKILPLNGEDSPTKIHILVSLALSWIESFSARHPNTKLEEPYVTKCSLRKTYDTPLIATN